MGGSIKKHGEGGSGSGNPANASGVSGANIGGGGSGGGSTIGIASGMNGNQGGPQGGNNAGKKNYMSPYS